MSSLGAKYPKLTKLGTIEKIAAVDLVNRQQSGYLNKVGREIRHRAIAHGVLLH